jgi:hypothetical protein
MADTGTSLWPADDGLNLPSDETISPADDGDGSYTFFGWMQRVTGMLRAIYTDLVVGMTHNLPMAGFKITGHGAPSASTDVATKGYVDAAAVGLDWKPSVRAATAVAGTLASSFENGDTVDGVVLATGDRILIKNQAAGAENGIYVVAASGAPARSSDADASAEVTAGLAVFVEEGTANADTGWLLTTNGAIVLGTTALTFTQFTSLGQITAGAGLTKTGSTLDVGASDTTITVDPDGIKGASGARQIAINPLCGYTAISGAWTPGFSTALYGGRYLISANNVGDAVSWPVGLDAGTYTLDVFVWKQVNGGTFTVKLDGVSVMGTLDAYDAGGVSAKFTQAGIVVAASGLHTLRVDVTGTNHANQNVYLLEFCFTRTA